jgi:hypothetical protein
VCCCPLLSCIVRFTLSLVFAWPTADTNSSSSYRRRIYYCVCLLLSLSFMLVFVVQMFSDFSHVPCILILM